jgi:phosphatidate cytidylyltransferase
MSNLQLRIVSAVILAAIVLALAWLGGLPFRILAALIAAAIFQEWMAMAHARSQHGWRGGPVGYVAVGLMAVFIAALAVGLPGLMLLGLAAALTAALGVLCALRQTAQWPSAGLAYAALSGLSLAALRGDDSAGLVAILFLFAVVWATDILAYFVGRAVGGPKLAPSISPGKTQSGALGGMAGGVIAGVTVAIAAGASNIAALALVALFLSIVSQAGDLFESWVKRRHGVKDSGATIPGHGGVMDRVDGLVASAFALYLIGAALGGIDHPASGLF